MTDADNREFQLLLCRYWFDRSMGDKGGRMAVHEKLLSEIAPPPGNFS